MVLFTGVQATATTNAGANSGAISLSSGTTTKGSTGAITAATGEATAGIGGSISLAVGDGDAAGGAITITSGTTTVLARLVVRYISKLEVGY